VDDVVVHGVSDVEGGSEEGLEGVGEDDHCRSEGAYDTGVVPAVVDAK